jgi:hypothetical protein
MPIMIDYCVWDNVPVHVIEWGELYGHYSSGFLLQAGGIGEQPERYLKAMSVFAGAYNKVERERHEKKPGQ